MNILIRDIDMKTIEKIDSYALKNKLSRSDVLRSFIQSSVDDLEQQEAAITLTLPLGAVTVQLKNLTNAVNENTHFVTEDLKNLVATQNDVLTLVASLKSLILEQEKQQSGEPYETL